MNRLSGIGPASVIARARRSGRLPSDAISLTVPPRKRGPRNTGRHARNSGPPLSRENDPVSRDALVPGDGDDALAAAGAGGDQRSEEHTSELQSLMRISYAVFCLKKKKKNKRKKHTTIC